MVNEAKKFKPGDKWSDDFDYVGMLKYGIQKKMPEQYKLEDLKKLAASMEDVNYHREAGHLFDTIGHLERAGAMARANKSIKGYGDLINKSWKLFRKEVGKTLKSIKEVRLNEELRDDELNTLATNLAYTMPNHTKFDDKKGPTDSQIMKAMKKYFKDLYKYSTTPQKKQAIKIVKKVLSEGKLNEITLKGKDADTWIRDWGAGGRLNINNMIYKSLGKGKWKGPDGKKLSWKEVAAKASALGDKRVFFEGKLNENVKAAYNALLKVDKGPHTKQFISDLWGLSVPKLKKIKDKFTKSYQRGNIWTGSKLDMRKMQYVMAIMKDKGYNQFEGKLNESQKITDNDIEKMADIAKKHKMKLAKMTTHKAVSGNWSYQKMYDELMDSHDGMSFVSDSDRKKFYKAVKKAFPKAKIKEAVDLKKHAKFGQTGVPFPQEEPNTFAFIDYKKWAYKYRKQYKKDVENLINKYGRHDNKLFDLATKWWVAYDKKTNKGAFSNIKNSSKFGRALIVMMRAVGLVFDKTQHYLGALQEETTMEKGKVNEISAGAGLSDVIKGKTSAIEGIKMSKQLAKYIGVWVVRSPYGRKYGKQILKGRIHSLIGPANSFGIERYLDSATKKEWKALYAKHGPKRESTEVAKKIKESSAEWAKTLKKLARQKKLDNITSKDKETLLKIVRMVKTANEAKLDKEKFTDPAQMKKKGIIKKGKKDIILGDKEEKNEDKVKGSDGQGCWDGYRYAGTDPKTGKDKCVKIKESFNPLKHPKNKY